MRIRSTAPVLLAALLLIAAWSIARAQVPPASGTAVYQHRAFYTGPAASAVANANVAVTVFPAGSIVSGCEIFNTGMAVLYVDLVTNASVGGATSFPIAPGASWRSPFPPTAAVSATAAAAQAFVAIRY